MSFEISSHALEQAQERNIPLELIRSTMSHPGQKIPANDGAVAYQSKVVMEGKQYLIRVIVNENLEPKKAITVYRTSKISRYWRGE